MTSREGFSRRGAVAMWTAVAALLGVPVTSSAQEVLSVEDRIRLLKTMKDCWQTASTTQAAGSADASTSAQADGAFKKLINAKASLDVGGAFKARMRAEFAPLTGNAAAEAAIEACYRMASGGDSLGLNSARRPPEPVVVKAKALRPAAVKPLAPPPEWTCRAPAVFLSATCERGGLGGNDQDVIETQGVVRGWKEEGVRHRTSCAHAVPSTGSVTARSECHAKEGTLRMLLENAVEGKGGHSSQKACAHGEQCLTSLAFRIDEGGADVRISPEAAGRYELQVDSVECSDRPALEDSGKVHLKAQFLGKGIPLTPGARFPLNSPGLVDVRFHGRTKYELKFAKEAFTGTTRCEVSLSLQPRR
ncbi:hypothetical protein [Stigmatella hybrida]|uniref:hypothetical protein n=1 Tax=Stigmatella hybrida TaxID=394097 RepID=UPI001CDA6415|nr:hypothetical protein [Stigmatella hybrida]